MMVFFSNYLQNKKTRYKKNEQRSKHRITIIDMRMIQKINGLAFTAPKHWNHFGSLYVIAYNRWLQKNDWLRITKKKRFDCKFNRIRNAKEIRGS